jgi:protein-L-isoaspartate O-methyltransferase
MAWSSSATTNDTLITKLKDNHLLHTPEIENAFRRIDRQHFSPISVAHITYADAPLRYEDIHMSAPHMYALVMEALEMKPEQSFLNIGSGSGYLSAIAAVLLGPRGIVHGIDINQKAVKHSRQCFYELMQKSGQIPLQQQEDDEECEENEQKKSIQAEFLSNKSQRKDTLSEMERIIATDTEDFENADIFRLLFHAQRRDLNNDNHLNAEDMDAADDSDSDNETPIALSFHIQETPTGSTVGTPSSHATPHARFISHFFLESLISDSNNSRARRSSMSAINTNSERSSSSNHSTGEPKKIPLLAPTQFIYGDAYSLDPDNSCSRYDRIYIGAGAKIQDVEFFKKFLAPGGIMIGPFDYSLLKVKRSQSGTSFESRSLTDVGYAPLIQPREDHDCKRNGIIPTFSWPLWSPKSSSIFPLSFLHATQALLVLQKRDTGLPSMLPQDIWYEIFEYCPRNWFEC